MTTVFGKIIRGEIPSERLYEDEKCIVIKDINPSADVHWLIIPKKEISSISEMKEEDAPLIGYCVWIAKKIADKNNIKGYKLIWNVNKEGGQVVFHVHLHLLAGNFSKAHLPV